MTEHLSQHERRSPNDTQETALRTLCDCYGVSYAAEHYYVYPPDSFMMAGYAEGWLVLQP